MTCHFCAPHSTIKKAFYFYYMQKRGTDYAHSSIGGPEKRMCRGMLIQELGIADISSERHNPILANVMAQLDYMEKRGSGLTRICDETKAWGGHRDELKPKFNSTPTLFQTIIFAFTDASYVGDHDGDVSGTKLSEGPQKILDFVKEYPTIKGKQM
jgi:ATP-dependent DNA helicase RecG